MDSCRTVELQDYTKSIINRLKNWRRMGLKKNPHTETTSPWQNNTFRGLDQSRNWMTNMSDLCVAAHLFDEFCSSATWTAHTYIHTHTRTHIHTHTLRPKRGSVVTVILNQLSVCSSYLTNTESPTRCLHTGSCNSNQDNISRDRTHTVGSASGQKLLTFYQERMRKYTLTKYTRHDMLYEQRLNGF